jgi:drug/metabolite transporter (DMT)-like permease
MELKILIITMLGFTLAVLGLFYIITSYSYQNDFVLGAVLIILGIVILVIGSLIGSKLKRSKSKQLNRKSNNC